MLNINGSIKTSTEEQDEMLNINGNIKINAEEQDEIEIKIGKLQSES